MQARAREQKHSFLDYLNEDYLTILAEEIEKHLKAYSESTDDWLHQKDHKKAQNKLEEIHATTLKRIDLTRLEQLAVLRLGQLTELAKPLASIKSADEFAAKKLNVKNQLKDIVETIKATHQDLEHDADVNKRNALKESLLKAIQQLDNANTPQAVSKSIQNIVRLQLDAKKSRHAELLKLHKELLHGLNNFLGEKHKRNKHIERLQRLLVATVKQYHEIQYDENEYNRGRISSKISNLDLMSTALTHADLAFANKWKLTESTDDCVSNPEKHADWKAFLKSLQECKDAHYHARISHDITSRFGIPENRGYLRNSSLIRRVNKPDDAEAARRKDNRHTFTTLNSTEINSLIDQDREYLKPLANLLKEIHRQHNQVIIWTKRNLQIAFTEFAVRSVHAQLENPQTGTSVTGIINDISATYKDVLSKVHAVQLHITTTMKHVKDALQLKGISALKLPIDASIFEPSYSKASSNQSGHWAYRPKSQIDFEDELSRSHEDFKNLLKNTLGLFTSTDQVETFAELLPEHYGHSENQGFQFPHDVIDDLTNNISVEPSEQNIPLSGQPDWNAVSDYLHREAIGKQKEQQADYESIHSEDDGISPPRSSSEDFEYASRVTDALIPHAEQTWGERHPVAKRVLIGLAVGGGIALLGAGVAAAVIFSGGTAAAGAAAAGAGIAAKLGLGGISGIFASIGAVCIGGGIVGGWVASILNRDNIANNDYELMDSSPSNSRRNSTANISDVLVTRESSQSRPSRSASTEALLNSSHDGEIRKELTYSGSIEDFSAFKSRSLGEGIPESRSENRKDLSRSF